MAKNIIACNLASYGKYAATACEHLSKIGIRHVEIAMPPREDVEKARAELGRYGLTVSSMIGACDIGDEAVAEKFALPLEVASRLDAKIIFISVHAGSLERQVAYSRLRRLGDLARGSGVVLAVETHPDLAENGDVALETMRNVNHPSVGINFDTGNIYYYNEGRNAVEEVRKIARYVRSVHLKDTNGRPRTWYFPTLGEGVVDFKGVFSVLNGVGFFGPFTFELEGIEGENLTLEQTRERVAKSLAHLRGIGCAE